MIASKVSVRVSVAVVAWAVVLAAAVSPVNAQEDYFRKPKDVVFRIDKERTRNQKIVIGSLVAGAVVFGGIGLAFNLDSRNKANEVSARGNHTGVVWTQDLEDTRVAGLRSRKLAIAGYGVGASLLIGAAVAFVVTDPGTKEVSYGDGKLKTGPRAYVQPTSDGVLVGSGWSF